MGSYIPNRGEEICVQIFCRNDYMSDRDAAVYASLSSSSASSNAAEVASTCCIARPRIGQKAGRHRPISEANQLLYVPYGLRLTYPSRPVSRKRG
jgi:hypothetical protein